MASEFDLIARYFTRPSRHATLGVGDDAALLRPAPGKELAISADMLVSGRHFFPDADPFLLGHKALAVNLSDLAAMGAQPRWALLSLALPEVDDAWLSAFSEGFFALAEQHGVDLVGGDTTQGPLNLSITILGEVQSGRALRRDAARAGDDIWVSGELGGAALALRHLRGEIDLGQHAEACLDRLHRPQPRVALGLALNGLAHAAIDLSDGLLADLGHILERSSCGARLDINTVPVSPAFQSAPEQFMPCALSGGDDYELCFTAPAHQREAIQSAAKVAAVSVTRIGEITAAPGLHDSAGRILQKHGFDHFG